MIGYMFHCGGCGYVKNIDFESRDPVKIEQQVADCAEGYLGHGKDVWMTIADFKKLLSECFERRCYLIWS